MMSETFSQQLANQPADEQASVTEDIPLEQEEADDNNLDKEVIDSTELSVGDIVADYLFRKSYRATTRITVTGIDREGHPQTEVVVVKSENMLASWEKRVWRHEDGIVRYLQDIAIWKDGTESMMYEESYDGPDDISQHEQYDSSQHKRFLARRDQNIGQLTYMDVKKIRSLFSVTKVTEEELNEAFLIDQAAKQTG